MEGLLLQSFFVPYFEEETKPFSGCLLKMFERKGRGKALVTLMRQCYKCN